jgi:hypothetical protein
MSGMSVVVTGCHRFLFYPKTSKSESITLSRPGGAKALSRLTDVSAEGFNIHMAMDQAGQAIKDRDQIFAYFEY